jgi:Cof subfamily protein (haloacid dehalogenase superfamily)
MKYKAVISDLDGTLLNSKHTVSDYTKEVVRNLSEKGIKFFIATGRHYLDIVHLRGKMNLDTFFITSNGARVHDSEGRVILKHNIDKKTAAEILSLEVDESIFVNIYKDDKWFISKENEMLKDFHSESDFFYNLIDFSNMGDCEPMKIFYLCEEEELLISLHNRLEENFGDRVNITFSTPNCLEIMKKGVSKGATITEIMDIEGISLEAAIAFGDGLNDYEMLKLVGKGLIMGNAHTKLKEALPENEVIGSNDEHSVAEYIKNTFFEKLIS